ncbi:unnamed protein product [Lymnaea stagnalis]|uniref:C2H2-type domain-containing protein n=1 Tax=Lymnaea stagnalis TaxID=6523 RepID=A0AAV2I148_LYMST
MALSSQERNCADYLSNAVLMGEDIFSSLSLDGASLLENLIKVNQFLSQHPHIVVTKYEIHVNVVDNYLSHSDVPQGHYYIIKEGDDEVEDEVSKKQNEMVIPITKKEHDAEDSLISSAHSEIITDRAEAKPEQVLTVSTHPLTPALSTANPIPPLKKLNSEPIQTEELCSALKNTTDINVNEGEMLFQTSIKNNHEIRTQEYPKSNLAETVRKIKVEEQDPKSHRCKLCNTTFQKAESLLVHELTHITLVTDIRHNNFCCPLCPFKAGGKRKIRSHIIAKHCITRLYWCHHCKFVGTSSSQLVHHRSQQEHKDAISKLSAAKTHKFLCAQCGYLAISPAGLRNHMVVHQDKKNFTCPVCSQTFKTEKNLDIHKAIHSTVKPFLCTFCPFSTHRRAHLNKHVSNTHLDVGKYKCRVCPMAFRQMLLLKEHAQSEHKSEDGYFCARCTFSSKDREKYKQHIQIHTGVNLYCCKICGFTAAQRGQAKRHELTHSAVLPFSCPICGRKFRVKRSLVNHITVHQNVKKLQCELCPYKTKSTLVLNRHMALHNQQKILRCVLCEYITKHRGNWHKHMKLHSTNKPYVCDICNYSFKFEESLTRHKTAKHNAIV